MDKIKYINFVKEKDEFRKNSNSPTHKLVVVYENGDKQYIGASWYSETKGFGSITLADGVSFNIPKEFKRYEPKRLSPEEQAEKDRKAQARADKKAQEEAEFNQSIDYGDANINLDDIPF